MSLPMGGLRILVVDRNLRTMVLHVPSVLVACMAVHMAKSLPSLGAP